MSRSKTVRATLLGLFAASLAFSPLGCERKEPAATAPKDSSGETASPEAAPQLANESSAPAATTAPAPQFNTFRIPPAPAELWKEFRGSRAFEEVQKQVDIGPRPAGSPAIEKAREHIESGLKAAGWTTERQEFTAETPRGKVRFVNIIGRFGAGGAPASKSTQQAILCSHYDTKRFSFINFVGANDAGSSTGALLEAARVLALDHQFAAKIELVFFDGEEALVQFTETDGLYGSRHYATDLRASGRAAQFKLGVLWDMIGEKDLTITMPPDSPAPLAKGILESADKLGLRQHFGFLNRAILDDHVPLNTISKIPTIDLIDFDYLQWHTADDTMERLSPESIEKVATVTIHYLKHALK